MKNKKNLFTKLLTSFACAIMLLCSVTPAFAASSEDYQNVDTTKKIYDYADLLTDEEETKLKETANELIDQYGYDVFFVIINYNDTSSTQAFADDFGDFNGFGLGNDNSYIGCVIDMDYNNFHITTAGTDCLTVYNDARIEAILDAMFKDIKAGDYSDAANVFFDKIDQYGNDTSGQVESITDKLPRSILFGILTGLALSGIITFMIARQAKTIRKGSEAANYTDEDLVLTRQNDRYVRTYETKIKRQSSSGGGTSTHSSSSGRSHGGGGRSF